ncbi:hypothetical protein DQ04_07681030 [Trypanosoma grayi]|uniref:hypothetical protein n=1 Tax=Trypanosoma grayi TaxID=71804 RepID=UPI0004F47182|nr:hypothetical protein DQ04_07681030 [Trypanosoma grayi]KEG08227.1 hypothetical protein DQ04_07681030 [Trypanosoma grayi]
MIHKRCKGCEAAALKVLTLLELIPAKHVREEWLRLALRVQIANVNPGVVCDGLVVNQKSLVLERRRAVRHLCYLSHRNIDGRVVNGVYFRYGIFSFVNDVLIVEHARILWCFDSSDLCLLPRDNCNSRWNGTLATRASDRESVASTSGEVVQDPSFPKISGGVYATNFPICIVIQVHTHVVLGHRVPSCFWAHKWL